MRVRLINATHEPFCYKLMGLTRLICLTGRIPSTYRRRASTIGTWSAMLLSGVG
jgi:hypothetical protein